MSTRRFFLLVGCLLLGASFAHAQRDSLPEVPLEEDERLRQLVEDVLANTEEDTDEFSFNAVFEQLAAYRRRPLNLNKATYDDLAGLFLLTDVQIGQILDYRDQVGDFLAVYELQVIPSLDVETIRTLAGFVRTGGDLDDVKTPIPRMLVDGNREFYLRWQRRLETARGYEIGPETGATNYYLGSPDRLYARYRHRYGNKLSYGVTMEKDPGEAFFAENNRKRGFDFYSAHLYLKDYNRTVRAVALGDYTVGFGQGLILFTGFGFGKSSQTTNVARSGPALRPYTSVNELSFYRGAATTIRLAEPLELTAFASRRGINGNRIATVTRLDTVEQEVLTANVSSLNVSGFNRTPNETVDRNAVQMLNFGGSLRYRPNSRLQLGVNLLTTNFDNKLLRLRRDPYLQPLFQGDRLVNASVDYRYRLRNFTFFGEVAGSRNGSDGQPSDVRGAQLHGVLLGLDRYTDFAVVYRNYGVGYQALAARPFGESNGGRNEEGLYFGLTLRPGNHWRINAYYDLFRFPYLRFNVDAPSRGHEYRLRVTYWQKRKLDTYVELRSETKGFGTDGDETEFTNLDPVVPRTRFQGRLHFGYKVTSALEWRSRLDAGFTEDPLNGRETGIMLLQDLHYRPRGPLSFSARLAFFNTADYDVRFYQYENGLLYNARVLPYYGRGTRSFLLVRYKGIRNLTVEGRIAQTYNTDGRTFGDGLEATGRPQRTEVGLQLIWRY